MNRRRVEKKDRERGRKRVKEECKMQVYKGGGIEVCGIVFRVIYGWDVYGCQEMILLGVQGQNEIYREKEIIILNLIN